MPRRDRPWQPPQEASRQREEESPEQEVLPRRGLAEALRQLVRPAPRGRQARRHATRQDSEMKKSRTESHLISASQPHQQPAT